VVANHEPLIVTEVTCKAVFDDLRKVMRWALDCEAADRIGLSRPFIRAFPAGGKPRHRTRSPFPDEVARAVADEVNLARLDQSDASDRGLRDIWEIIIVTGRRVSEVLGLKLGCVQRHNGVPILWHDQTKVGNFDEAIRIPEHTYERIRARQRKTLNGYERRFGHAPGTAQVQRLALFPAASRNRDLEIAASYTWFSTGFRAWIRELELGGYVAHQARHTLATRLLAAGAGMHHIQRYLGHVSQAMTEHYAKVALSEIDDILHHVWVAGPGSPAPGDLLSSGVTGLSRKEAEALAVDLNRRSTPSEGGLCTSQVVVDGGRCPWKLDCGNCDKFVMTGADLLYWRRKREQWHSIAERAPDDTTADYLHQVFEPTARAIDGLEKALAGLGLLDEALTLDMRRPQDYFHRLWSTGFAWTGRGRDARRARGVHRVCQNRPPARDSGA
jgi:integrase